MKQLQVLDFGEGDSGASAGEVDVLAGKFGVLADD